MVFLPTDILPRSLLGTMARVPLAFVGRRARRAAGSRRGARYVEGLASNAHYNDALLASTVTGDVVRYRRGAVEFVEVLSRALDEAGRSWGSVRTCLDAACGYGRIVRELRYEVPLDAISVCDAGEEGADFTVTEFGVRKVPLLEQMGPQFENSYHLVYLLDVYTRGSRRAIAASLAKAERVLRPDGVLVFTTLAPATSAELDAKAHLAWAREGFAHTRFFDPSSAAGSTLVTAEAMTRLVAEVAPSLSCLAHWPCAVENRQDVFAFRKS